MKILLLGATGGTGKQVLLQSLEKGYKVTALVRNPAKITEKHPELQIARGDVMVPGFDDVFSGHDAVICCLGSPPHRVGTLRSAGTANIIGAMKKNHIRRLICQSSLGFGDSNEVLKFTSFTFRKIIVPFILKKTFMEHQLQETIVKESELDWTIVRPGKLTNGRKTGQYKHGFPYSDSSLKVEVSRADVAEFLIAQLNSGQYLRKAAGISY